MPYSSNGELPESVRGAIPSSEGKTLFRRVVNSQLRNGKSESVAFASAWSALQNAGYKKEDGKWVQKENPTSSSVHVPSTNWKKPRKKALDLAKAYGAEPVYGFRPVLNAEEICEWAKNQGFKRCMVPDEMHTTVLYSKRGFSPELSMRANDDEMYDNLSHWENIVIRGGDRTVEPLGDKGAIVLRFDDDRLQNEHAMYLGMGAGYDFDKYLPHVTLTYSGFDGDMEKIEPYQGDIVLGATRYRKMNVGGFDPNSIPHMDLSDDVEKYQFHRDVFTMPDEARVRSVEMGLGGAYHVHEIEGQGFYMPGATHKEYLDSFGPSDDDDDEMESPVDAMGMFSTFISTVTSTLMGKKAPDREAKSPEEVADTYFDHTVIKVDDEQRIVWGWASVTTVNGEPVKDLHGDVIETSTMVKAADNFMLYNRTAKAMHEGDGIGFVIHSLPLSKELGEALGIYSEREGWVVAMKILDEDHWRRIKSGEFRGFSIGGRGRRVPNDED